MKTIIAGTRTFNDYKFMRKALDGKEKEITEVVSGSCAGADHYGEMWAKARLIPVKLFPANWKKEGRSAGPKRNEKMAEYADALIAFWDGESMGTLDMIKRMEKLKKPVDVLIYGKGR